MAGTLPQSPSYAQTGIRIAMRPLTTTFHSRTPHHSSLRWTGANGMSNDALEVGLKEKAKEFKESGAEVYAKA